MKFGILIQFLMLIVNMLMVFKNLSFWPAKLLKTVILQILPDLDEIWHTQGCQLSVFSVFSVFLKKKFRPKNFMSVFFPWKRSVFTKIRDFPRVLVLCRGSEQLAEMYTSANFLLCIENSHETIVFLRSFQVEGPYFWHPKLRVRIFRIFLLWAIDIPDILLRFVRLRHNFHRWLNSCMLGVYFSNWMIHT